MIDEKACKDAFEAGFRKGVVVGAEEGVKVLAMLFENSSQNDKNWSPYELELLKFCSASCLDSAPIVINIIKRILAEQGKEICNLMWQGYIQK